MISHRQILPCFALILTALLLLAGPSFAQGRTKSGVLPGPEKFDTKYGNSDFGSWINDEFGLPAFRYDGCKKDTCTEPADAFHQLGNGNVTAVAHKDGYVELFTAKTFYRYANHYEESKLNFSGGFGWVRDGSQLWSTLYADNRPAQSSYERLFGMAYYKKTIEYGGLRVEQYVYAAPGTDEALLEHIVFTNLSGASKSIQYFDYWDVAWWLVSCNHPTGFPPGYCNPTSAYDPAQVRTSYDAGRAALKATSLASGGNLDMPSLTGDPSPKASFVAFLGDAPDRFDTLKEQFFAGGTRASPGRIEKGNLANSVDSSGALPNQKATLVTQKSFALGPHKSRELNVLYGIAPLGNEDTVIDRYRSGSNNLLPQVMEGWAARIPRIELPEEPWIAREMVWSTYYLLSGMLREDFFNTRVINQGSIYQYVWGANAGPRSALRHVMPVIYLEPDTAREVITYYLRAMKNTGELAYATAGYGGWQDMGFQPSDSSLWLLWAAAEYVFATRDFAFLDTMHDFYCDAGRGACGTGTAYEMLKKAYAYQVQVVGTEPAHNLVRIGNSDWDDLLTSPLPPPFGEFDAAKTVAEGESTLNTALATVAYPMLAALAERRGDTDFVATVSQASAALKSALQKQWQGKFFNRAYVIDKSGHPLELGNDNLWLAANAFALIPEELMLIDQKARLVERMQSDLFASSTLGLAAQGLPIEHDRPGAGFWYSLAGPTIEGLAKQTVKGARELAWCAFRQQTLATHAQTYHTIWYGVWSGPDKYFTPIDSQRSDPRPGETWCYNIPFIFKVCMLDFPVTNMFSHSEPLLSSVRMAGLSATPRGLIIDPAFPFETFRWESPAFAVARTPTGVEGRLTTAIDDTLELRVGVPDCARQWSVTVGGQQVSFTCDAGFVRFDLPATHRVPARWSVRSASLPAQGLWPVSGVPNCLLRP